jgi:hypothetical protein
MISTKWIINNIIVNKKNNGFDSNHELSIILYGIYYVKKFQRKIVKFNRYLCIIL